MLSNYEELSDMQIDVLREIGNIGAGNAASALATILDEQVDISLPKVKVTDFDTAVSALGGPETMTVGVLIKYHGEGNGMIMFLLDMEDAKGITDILVQEDNGPENELSDLKLSAIKEIGNILSSSYINSIATLTGMDMQVSVPYVAIDMAGALMSVPIIEFGAIGDKVMYIDESFIGSGGELQKLQSHVIMFAEIETLKNIMERLGI